MNGSFERDTYIGHDAQHMRGVLALKYPMKNGIVRNWDDMEMVGLLSLVCLLSSMCPFCDLN